VNASFLKTLVNRVVAANSGYVFNLRGRWRYETVSQRRSQAVSRPREWSGEVLAYAWLARQAKDRAKTTDKPDAQILALTRS
jgi:hypothetical protein